MKALSVNFCPELEGYYVWKVMFLYVVIAANISNDIALIHISPADTPVIFTDYIQPICLATPQFDVERHVVDCYASGWGDIRGFGKLHISLHSTQRNGIISIQWDAAVQSDVH